MVSVKTGVIGSAVAGSVSVVGSVVIMVVLVRSCDYCICFNSLQTLFCRERRFIFWLAKVPVVVSKEVEKEWSPIKVWAVSVIGCVFHRFVNSFRRVLKAKVAVGGTTPFPRSRSSSVRLSQETYSSA